MRLEPVAQIGACMICLLVGIFIGTQDGKKQEVKTATFETEKPKKDFLTVDDLRAIYECVDTKIKNQHRELKFPCVSVRGDSF